ncbi:hypothetical protein HOK51_05265 [Candidatus Woesearchaeota archaeon]|jgi:predicted ribonuclease YlaK|nr:hypothetical protein [Candidatus Woesearchaeota archaeon]MBT6519237.1 hypothetical protein [Candidatus Woesearchaeota archaeon]MBT7366778.1 hypothetical protein [Candidatus Woesearchaeota archaeon]
MKEEYHEIFIPLLDVYSEGGTEVFRNLERKEGDEKNLVVIPRTFTKYLQELKDTQHDEGSADALRFLKEAARNKVIHRDKGITLCRVSTGLDVAIIDDNKTDHENKKTTVSELEELVMNKWELPITDGKKHRPEIITSVENYHIKYLGRGMRVKDPEFLLVNSDIVNEGIILGNNDLYARLQNRNEIVNADDAAEMLEREDLYLNQFIKFLGGENRYEYARVCGDLIKNRSGTRILEVENKRVELLRREEYKKHIISPGGTTRDNILGIKPLDMEQYIAFQYGLLNPDVSLMFICGEQGSGKTLLSYAAAIDQILYYNKETRQTKGIDVNKKENSFKKIVLIKPNEILGGKRREIGFLPGSLFDKIRPHLEPYIDAHKETILNQILPFEELLKHPKFENEFGMKPRDAEFKNKRINGGFLPPRNPALEVPFSGFMRGRSFRNTILLVDEAQNYTPYELKTVLERLGPGCKAVVMGDPKQFDNPLTSKEKNGLTAVIKHYIEKPYSMQIKLIHNYRNQISEDATSMKYYSTG